MKHTAYEKAPWKIEQDRFVRSTDQTEVAQELTRLAREHVFLTLTIQQKTGLHFEKSIVIREEADTLLLDKPVDWRKGTGSCRIFFKDRERSIWNYIDGEILSENLYTLTITRPTELFTMQTRAHRRIEAPPETTASFSFNEKDRADFKIIDLSAAGMLICSGTKDLPLDPQTPLEDITISMAGSNNAESDEATTFTPTIDRGLVVRTYHDQRTETVCLGISFEDTGQFSQVLEHLGSPPA